MADCSKFADRQRQSFCLRSCCAYVAPHTCYQRKTEGIVACKWQLCTCYNVYNVQNPLYTFPRNFSVDGKVANLLPTPTCWQQVVVMEFGKRHNGLLIAPTCYGLARGKLTGVMDFGLYDIRFRYLSRLSGRWH